MTDYSNRLEFNLEGQLLDLVMHHGKLKYLRLKLPTEELQIKLSKATRTGVLACQPGDSIRVLGQGKFDGQTQELKLKATQIMPLHGQSASASLPPAASTANPTAKPKVKLLVCQKSGCLKRGQKLWETLEQMLCERDLMQHVTIKQTGCLKRCSSAPSLVITPGNHQYRDVCPKMLPKIAETVAQKLLTV